MVTSERQCTSDLLRTRTRNYPAKRWQESYTDSMISMMAATPGRYKKITKRFMGVDGKNFVSHLVRSLVLGAAKYIWTFSPVEDF